MLHSQQHKQRPESTEEVPQTLGPEVGGARSQVWGGCGVQGKGPDLPLGTKGGAADWHLAVRRTTGGYGTPQGRYLLETLCLAAKGCLIWAGRTVEGAKVKGEKWHPRLAPWFVGIMGPGTLVN